MWKTIIILLTLDTAIKSMNLSPLPPIAKETVLNKDLPKPVFLIHHLIISKLCFNNCTFQTERKNEASCVTYDIAPLLLKNKCPAGKVCALEPETNRNFKACFMFAS